MADQQKLNTLTKKVFKDQAIWMLNALWPKQKDSKAEELWNLVQIFSEIEIENHENGCEVDEFQVHRVFEKLGEQKTVQEMRNHLRTVGVEKFKNIGMLHFLIWHYQQDWHAVVNASQGDNTAELEQAKQMLDEVSKLFAESQQKAETAKKSAAESTQKAAEAKKSAEDAAARQAEAQAAENEVTAALNDVKEKEAAKERKREALQKKIETAGLVAKNAAINELAQLDKEDDLPLRKAKTTLEAAQRKAAKTLKAATDAKEIADRDAESAEKSKQAAIKAQEEAELAVEQMAKKVEEAEAYLKEQQENASGSGQGSIWWLNRELEEKKKYLPTRKGGVAKN
ncbi:Calcium-regulated actin-bundling protein C-terminal domain-containing protein [Entamoeba marina]